jgi:hypothetical protein
LVRRLNEIESILNDLTPFCGLSPPRLRKRVDLFAVSTNLSWSAAFGPGNVATA